MNASIFFERLVAFYSYIGEKRDRKSLLLIGNAYFHGTKHTIPALKNVEVYYLPPNTTSAIQLFDAGIMRSMNSKFIRRQMKHRLSQSEDTNPKDFYKLNLKQNFYWKSEIWMNLYGQIIYDCWDTTEILNC